MRWPASLPQALAGKLDAAFTDRELASGCAAFDADGTLWAGDVGELLLKAMIGLARAPIGAWVEYERLLKSDAPAACAYCVQLLRGISIAQLSEWSRELVQSHAHEPIHAPVVDLLRALERFGCETWIVSGSNLWTVREAVEAIGLDPRRVLALKSRIENGVLSGEAQMPVTCARGKIEALRAATSRPLLFAAGNALYDLQLLEQARFPLAVAPQAQPTPFRTEAERRGWSTLDISI